MHDVKIAIFCQPNAQWHIDDGFHIRRNDRNTEFAPTQFNACIALRAAFYAAFTWQK
jgi:hypothetical protein